MSLHTIPIAQRPPHGPLFSKVLFPVVFSLAQIGIITSQFLALPLLLVPFVGQRAFSSVVAYTKDGYGRLLILITVLFGPTHLVLTTDSPELADFIERDAKGNLVKIHLPDRMVIMANHQAYLDWMYLWILACYSGNGPGIIILLKASLKHIPVVGWGMRFFRFIFLNRSWAADRDNLTKALSDLAREARTDKSTLLGKARSSLWLLIFPEGTIISDEERVKSVRYADREGIDDLVTLLLPRSTGLLFCLRTLLPEIPDLKLLDITIGYPGVPYNRYPQDYYGLFSVFLNSVPPPTVHLHLRLYTDLTSETSEIPALHIERDSEQPGLANAKEARAFELWLRSVWQAKEKRMEGFYRDQRFPGSAETIPITQQRWTDHIRAFGAGGLAVLVVAMGRLC